MEDLPVGDITTVIAELETEFSTICDLGDVSADSRVTTASRYQCC